MGTVTFADLLDAEATPGDSAAEDDNRRYLCIDGFYAFVGCVIAYVLKSNGKSL